MKQTALVIGLTSCVTLSATGLSAQTRDTDPVITVQPTISMSTTESFARRFEGAALRDDPSLLPSEQLRAAVSDFSLCLYKGAKPGVRKVLSVGPGSELTKRVRGYIDGQCWLRGYVNFRPSAFQQALFAAAYNDEFGKTPPVFAATPVNYAGLLKQASPDQTRRYLALSSLAECVARANPSGAQKLVTMPIATSKEKEAFNEIMPSLSNCTDAGRQIALDKESIKGSLAEVLYRNAKGGQMAGAAQ